VFDSTSRAAVMDSVNFSSPEDVWDEVVKVLEETGGVATVHLPVASERLHSAAFSTAREALEMVCSNGNESVLRIPEDAGSAHASGYHGAGSTNSLSRYNQYREGFVFSDGASFQVNGVPAFETKMERLFLSLHGVALQVLLAFERRFELPVGWFEEALGPTGNCSQWHLKRYVQDPQEKGRNNDEHKEPDVLLPMHTDPSIISVVIHDAEGKNPSALGLQYQSEAENGQRTWKEVPYHGHAVATVFVGSVLAHITGGRCPSVKHRVVHRDGVNHRTAATLFLRPQPSAMLQVPPSPAFQNVQIKNVSFGAWLQRVSKNYSKKRVMK
jgi:isopenicillin N synthase-like dioxygenase